MQVTFIRIHGANRGTSSYQAKGVASGTIYLSKNAFNGQHPDELVIDGVPELVEKPKVDKAAKAEALKNMSPAEKAAARLERARKALARAEAKAAAATAEPVVE